MSDLTRRVLNAAKNHGTGAYTTRYTEPTLTLANAAPTLARQVEAIEALADRLDATISELRATGRENEADGIAHAVAHTRDALTEAEKGSTP